MDLKSTKLKMCQYYTKELTHHELTLPNDLKLVVDLLPHS